MKALFLWQLSVSVIERPALDLLLSLNVMDVDTNIFRPIDAKKPTRSLCRLTARYCIRSGPKQFASYLSGMIYSPIHITNYTLVLVSAV